MRLLGLVPLAFYVVHALASWHRGRWYNALWLCHAASVALGIGLLAVVGISRSWRLC